MSQANLGGDAAATAKLIERLRRRTRSPQKVSNHDKRAPHVEEFYHKKDPQLWNRLQMFRDIDHPHVPNSIHGMAEYLMNLVDEEAVCTDAV